MSKPKTAKEVRQEFLEHLRLVQREWSTLPDKSVEDRLDGLAFSFLSLLDGACVDFPAVDLVLRPHPDDESYFKEQGDDWYVDGQIINDCYLHEIWHKIK